MKKLQERLRDVSQQKQSEAWRRTDGGQDLSIGAMLADEAATALDTLEAEVARLREVIEIAYGFLWRDRACSPQSNDARIYLLSLIDKEGQKRGIGEALAKYGPVSDAEILATPLSAQEDVVERFTPNEIIMLLHFYCSAAPFDRIHAPACQAAVQRFLAAGWIEPSNKSGNQYHTTAAGTVMVNAICRITSTDRERGLEEAGNAVDLGIAKAKHRCEHWLGRLEAGIDDQEMTFERIIDELRNAGAISDSLKRSQEKG